MKSRMNVIEFTDRHVKFLQATRRNGSPDVHCCEAWDIEKTAALHKIPPETLIVMIPSRYVTLRYAELPSQDRRELHKMLDLQIIRYTPHAREDIVFDFLIVDEMASGYSRVLLMIIQREVLGRYLEILQQAGILPYRVTISAEGIWRWCACPERPAMVIHIDNSTLEICFCRQEKLLFVRSVPYDLNILGNANSLVEHIQKAMEIYENEVPGKKVESITLLAENREVSIKEILETRYQCPVHVLSCPPETVPKNGLSYFAALGGMFHDRLPRMNFLPPEIKERYRRRVRQKQWLTSALLITAIGILWLIVLGKSIRMESIYAGQLQEQTRQMSSIVQHITETKEQVEFLEKEVLSQALVADIFRRLSLLMPENVSLESFSSRDGEHCTLKGISGDDAGVNQLYRNLVDSHAFSDVILEYSKKRKVRSRELTEFRIRCVVTSVQETL